VGLDVSVLGAVGHVQPRDVDRSELGVVGEAHGLDLGSAIGSHRGQAPMSEPGDVPLFDRCECHAPQPRTSSNLEVKLGPQAPSDAPCRTYGERDEPVVEQRQHISPATSAPRTAAAKGGRMPEHRVGTQAEWQAERDELLAKEKELTRRSDALAEQRRQLPWVPVEKEYRFETEDGTKSLGDLFDGRSQLLVYHFMFGPTYEAGCPVCSSIADTLAPQVPHLKAKDTTLLLASRAPLAKLIAYRERMGWGIDWVSSGGSDFNRDLGFLHTQEELRPFLEGGIPPTVEQNARMCGTDAAGYLAEGPGLS